MPFTIVCQDITKMDVDAIVNAANTDLVIGGGVCGAIFKSAGAALLQAACDKLSPIQTGEAVLTPGFNLPAKYIIHAAGPVYHGGERGEESLLRSCYAKSLELAWKHGCGSIAFPLISSGIYGYPKEGALRVATSAIRAFLDTHDMDVYLAVFDKAALAAGEKLLGEVASYIDEHFVEEHGERRRAPLDAERRALEEFYPQAYEGSLSATDAGLDRIIGNLDESFSATLLRLIDAKGRKDVEVYKRANLDRKLFSKIRTGNGYMPSKRTALALAVALELSRGEIDDLLRCAGYALSRAVKFDVIVEYFVSHGKYDIFEINEVLFQYDQPLLGG